MNEGCGAVHHPLFRDCELGSVLGFGREWFAQVDAVNGAELSDRDSDDGYLDRVYSWVSDVLVGPLRVWVVKRRSSWRDGSRGRR